MACFIFLLVLLAVSGGGQRVCANQNNIVISAVSKRGTIPAGVLHRLIALPRLLAAGTRAHVWMIIPVKPLKPGAGPQFLLLSHTINARHGNAGLWKPVSAGTFTGYPVCALAANNPLVGAMKQGVYLFFQNGDGVCFGRKELLRLPATGGTFSPVAAAGDNGSVYLLVYGVARTTPLQKTSPAQRILRRLKVLESKMMGTPPPTPIVPGSPAMAQAPGSAKAIPSGPPELVIKKMRPHPISYRISLKPKLQRPELLSSKCPPCQRFKCPCQVGICSNCTIIIGSNCRHRYFRIKQLIRWWWGG